jgi:hypothetical protein
MYIYDNISLNSSENEKCLSIVVEQIKAHIFCSITFPEKRTVYEIMWENVLQADRPQMTI